MIPIPEVIIEVSKNEIKAATEALECLTSLPCNTKGKVKRSALYEVYKKLKRKQLTQPKKKNKKYSLKMKYYEMQFLEEFFDLSLSLEFNQFCKTFRDKLNQKLA